jgi:hypothetical protein
MTKGHQRERRSRGFQGREEECKFSSVAGGERKNSSTLRDYREAKAAGLSFLPIHIKSCKMLKFKETR